MPEFFYDREMLQHAPHASADDDFYDWDFSRSLTHDLTTESPLHSRNSSSSCASCNSSPISPNFSYRGHNRFPSSTSSLATSPELPNNPVKSALHDLVEDPSEREDSFDLAHDSAHEPFCICDTSFCEHRDSHAFPTTNYSPEWTPGDDSFGPNQLTMAVKRRRSGDEKTDSITARLSRRWPSISQRLRDPKASPSLSSVHSKSVPSSRPSSLRLPSLRRSVAATADSEDDQDVPPMPDMTPAAELVRVLTQHRSSDLSSPLGIEMPQEVEDPIDREKLSSTPLLPPVMAELQSLSAEELSSPLQSPSVASIASSPEAILQSSTVSLSSPPLSAKPSVSSFKGTNAPAAVATAPAPLALLPTECETDPWAIKLGHANFHITPAPYLPDKYTNQTCAALLADWETARKGYLHQASRIAEHYGATSLTFALTEAKWSELDAQWRTNLSLANAAAVANGEEPARDRLKDFIPTSAGSAAGLPTVPHSFPLGENGSREKFPGMSEDGEGIVGPMVQYAARNPSDTAAGKDQTGHGFGLGLAFPTIGVATKKSPRASLLRIFSDPGTLLQRRRGWKK